MVKAFFQNKAGKYYHADIFKGIVLLDQKLPLNIAPEEMVSIEEVNFIGRKHHDTEQTGFIFRGDNFKIINHIFFTQGMNGDCILTLEGDKNLCGNLDFSTCHIKIGGNIGTSFAKISCVHF